MMPADKFVELAFEAAESLPVGRREAFFRAIVATTAVPCIAALFTRCADELRACEERFEQMRFAFHDGFRAERQDRPAGPDQGDGR